MPDILILCPTHDHADTLFAAIASAQAQTLSNWEMVVLCDGCPARTQTVLEAITQRDGRISTVRFPKSERFGENHRDPVIRQSRARIVCQLSDDDLWLPDHLAVMTQLLEHADWANQAPLRLQPDGQSDWWPVNMGTPQMKRSQAAGIPLSAGPNFVAYRREAYLALPEGWTCAPREAGPSDSYMWAKFFRQPGLRIASTARTTALKLPSQVESRKSLTPEQRLSELTPWLARLSEPGLERNLQASASILQRMVRLFAVHGAGETAGESALKAGLEIVDAREMTRPALQGAPMRLPLNEDQRAEMSLAHDFIRARETGDAMLSAQLRDDLSERPGFWTGETCFLKRWGAGSRQTAAKDWLALHTGIA